MKHLARYVGFLGLSVLVSSCAHMPQTPPTFDEGQSPAVRTTAEFDQIVSDVAEHEGKAIKLAGRIRRIEETEEGYKVLASWLPFPAPKDYDRGPRDAGSDDGIRFIVYYPEKVKKRVFFIIKGNKFVLEGTVGGTETAIVDMFGKRQDLLYITASCVRVWETGQSTIGTTADSEEYAGAIARTFCVGK